MDIIKSKIMRNLISIRAVEVLLFITILFVGSLFTMFELNTSTRTLEANMLISAKMLATTFFMELVYLYLIQI